MCEANTLDELTTDLDQLTTDIVLATSSNTSSSFDDLLNTNQLLEFIVKWVVH